MSYTDPSQVLSPKTLVRNVRVIENEGEGSYSIAKIIYDEREVLACRWNGGDQEPSGHPNSRGIPTWFVIPDRMKNDILKGVFSRAKNERYWIYNELEDIRNEFKYEGSGTEIIIHPLSEKFNLSDANLLVELIKSDEALKDKNVDVFDVDSEGNRTNNPISQIAGKLHVTLLREN